ncbi:hypothetical protein PHMEG_00018325 [Phytophthora megakarya]|uniref:Eukaryotic/viral aspartic protease n=1 Tax=Phytophthora megakarya TaxID=4795 RepID=A0A225VVM5_9STRA|nr:hypothetical protein PHMEG_00018325 [Phytophthora megakarya]
MQLRDMHTLEDIASDTQKVEMRISSRSSSQSPSRRDDMRHSSSKKSYGQDHSTHVWFRRCLLCQQVHDFGKSKAFDELAKTLRTNVDKKNISCPLTEIGLVPTEQPQSADLVIDAEFLYAFTGKCEWPEDDDSKYEYEKHVEFDGECGVRLDGGKLHVMNENTTTKRVVNDDWLGSICEAGEVAPMLAKTVKLLPGERMEWWSSQRFDRRVRMRVSEEDFDPLGHWRKREHNHDEVGVTTTAGPYPDNGRQLE